MKEKNKEQHFSVVLSVLLVVLTGAVVCCCSYFYNENIYQFIRNGVMAVMGALVVLESFWLSAENEKLDWQKEYGVNFNRFFIVYLAGLLFAVVCPLLPVFGWPYMVFFVALACFSNMACGIASGTVLLMLSVFLTSEAGMNVFILYFMSGIVAITLFQNIDESFKAVIPVIVSSLFLVVCETANIFLPEAGSMDIKSLVILLVNVALNIVLLLAFMSVYRCLVVNKYKARYQEINDVEYMLLVRLKEKNPEEYYHVIHTAHLSEIIADKLHLDASLTKIAAYYLKTGMIFDENSWENVKKIFEIHKFPQPVIELLRECMNESRPKRKETIVILFADEVIKVLQEIFKKDIDAKVDYAKIVDKIYHEKIVTGLLRENPITYTELQIMRKQFLEEKLYYDILR